jgi:hypothetical protein
MIGDAEPWDVFESKDRRAVKAHRCTECGRTIDPGETYQHAAGLMDGNWFTFKTCAHCRTCCAWLVAVCDGYLFEGVLEDLGEHRFESVASWWLLRRIAEARRKWRRSDGTLYPLNPPRRGRDYPVVTTLRQGSYAFLSGSPRPEGVAQEQVRLTLAAWAALWHGWWWTVDGASGLRFAASRVPAPSPVLGESGEGT